MSRCGKIQSFCVPLKRDLSMTLSRSKSSSGRSAEKFQSEIEPQLCDPEI